MGRDARECFPTAEGSSNPHTSAAVLQCEGTGNNPMRYVTEGPWSCPVAEWATCGLRIKSSVISRNTLHADRKRVTGHRVKLREVWFETYIYGRDVVHVDSDHKPLETIMLKPLHAAPQRLLRLQKYNLELRYKKGCDMFLADTLSRAYLPEVNASELTQELEGIDHKFLLPVSEARWQQIEHASADDPVLQELRLMTQRGWPSNRSDVLQVYLL